MSEDRKWLSNGHWLFKTELLDSETFPSFLSTENEMRAWLAGVCGSVHPVNKPCLGGKAIEDIHSWAKSGVAAKRTSLVLEGKGIKARAFKLEDGSLVFLNIKYDEMFGRPAQLVYTGSKAMTAPLVDNPEQPSIIIMPVNPNQISESVADIKL